MQRLILQVKRVVPLLSITYIILLGLLLSSKIISELFDIPIAHFTRDPAVIIHQNPFKGVISNLGVFIWSFTVAVCFFSSVIYWKENNVKISKFIFFSGLFTLILLIDDLFMIHDFVFPRYLHLSDIVVYLTYFIFIILYFVNFGQIILKTEYLPLQLALGFFALSILSDQLLPISNMKYLLEDGFKLFGIVAWFIYIIKTNFAYIQSYTSKLYLIERRKIDKNRSRREFLSFFGKITLVFAIPIALPASNKTKNEEEYVFINGWLLKKKDLNDI